MIFSASNMAFTFSLLLPNPATMNFGFHCFSKLFPGFLTCTNSWKIHGNGETDTETDPETDAHTQSKRGQERLTIHPILFWLKMEGSSMLRCIWIHPRCIMLLCFSGCSPGNDGNGNSHNQAQYNQQNDTCRPNGA